MSGTDRLARLRAIKTPDIGRGGPALHRKLEAEEEDRAPDLNEADQREVTRLISMLEVAFLAAAADGELGEGEMMNIVGNMSHWLGGELPDELIHATLDTFAQALEEQGFEARLAELARHLDADSRRVAYNLGAAVAICDQEVREEELGVLGDIASAFEIPEDEAQARFNEIFDGMQAALAQA